MNTRTAIAGFTLIEVLIAVAILSFGLLGIAAMQVTGVRANQGSYSRSQAIYIANDMAERMYTNRTGLAAFSYDNFDSSNVACGSLPAPRCSVDLNNTAASGDCTAAQMATYDRYIASCGISDSGTQRGGVKDMLPTGKLTVTCLPAACEANPASVACTTALASLPTGCTATSARQVKVSWVERVKTSATTANATQRSAGSVADEAQAINIMVEP